MPFVPYGSGTRRLPLHLISSVENPVAAHSLSCFLLDVVPGTGVISELDDSCKAIKTVADSNVERLSEYAITLLRVRDNLRVAA